MDYDDVVFSWRCQKFDINTKKLVSIRKHNHQNVNPRSGISSSPDSYIWRFTSPLLTVMSLSEILPGKTEEMNENPPPGAIPTSAFTVVWLL